MAAATAKKINIYEKLMLARINFGEADKKKSGVNSHAEFTYYELSDIVPVATKIFNDLGLTYLTTMTNEQMIGRLIDNESKEELVFTCPFVTLAEPGKYRQNEIQALGSAITYLRRYMYMIVLDIVEPDAYDCLAEGGRVEEKAPEVPKPPVTAEKRAEVKGKLTESELATEEQVKELKALLKAYKTAETEEEVQKIIAKTDKFKKMTCEQAKALIAKYSKKVGETK